MLSAVYYSKPLAVWHNFHDACSLITVTAFYFLALSKYLLLPYAVVYDGNGDDGDFELYSSLAKMLHVP